ncbi:transposase [Scytonema sp. UIC 10036]|uniref:transposase n=1 Tax=Scytonema sp. UIC 10036 TaxID=2304196 RepID=UPI0012DA79B6|nr:transposase [Scytonema sp. UIC 10036]MUG91297.1 transposase [Scytonema sp. UIC 10036]
MARKKTPSFITEIPLIVDSSQEKELLSKFEAARQLYNACLNEAMVRMELVRNSEAFKLAKKIPKSKKKERTDAFSAARSAYRYSDYDLQAYATIVANLSKWIADKIDSNTQQTIAKRAFKASVRVIFGRAKKVRFKVSSRFHSVEGKTNKQGLRWKNNELVWGSLKLRSIIDESNPVIMHGLQSPVKYVRILWRELNGKRRWYAQLINEGLPYQKEKNYVSNGLIGLDLNISNIAFVGDEKAGLLPFAKKVPTYEREITALQRKMQRSQRVNNPNNYESDFEIKKGHHTVKKKGKVKKGKREWNRSKNYQKTAQKKRELQRKKAAYAKSQNRKVVNEILRNGKDIKTENVSVKGWQKRYGKAISAKSPGFVLAELIRKAENAGGTVHKFSTQKTALSQTHLDGSRTKKSLSERVHHDATGIKMHRDLMSAYLSRFVNQDDTLSVQDARNGYRGAEPLLLEAWQQSKNREQVGSSESGLIAPERFSDKLRQVNQIADCLQSERKVNPNSQPESAQL